MSLRTHKNVYLEARVYQRKENFEYLTDLVMLVGR